jgi:hypothetical protein
MQLQNSSNTSEYNSTKPISLCHGVDDAGNILLRTFHTADIWLVQTFESNRRVSTYSNNHTKRKTSTTVIDRCESSSWTPVFETDLLWPPTSNFHTWKGAKLQERGLALVLGNTRLHTEI